MTNAAIRTRFPQDARDKFILGASRALEARMNLQRAEPGNEFNGLSLSDIARHALILAGNDASRMTPDQVARKVLAQHSTSDFPELMENAAGKVLRTSYAETPTTWSRWCKTGSVKDFKVHPRIALGSFSSLLAVPEGSEFKEGDLGEEAETIQAGTKGRLLTLSRQMIVNDELETFAERTKKLGRAAARTIDSDVYTYLAQNTGFGPVMSDGYNMFNTGTHGNNAAGASAITVQSIAAGEAVMMKRLDPGQNNVINLVPRFLLCSAEKKQVAWEVLNSVTDVAQSNPAKANFTRDQMKLEVVATPYLDANPWYLIADPADAELVEVAFLEGKQEPRVESTSDFGTDAVVLKVALDYGVAGIDWRAGYRNAGA